MAEVCDPCGRPLISGHGELLCRECDCHRIWRVVRHFASGSRVTVLTGLTKREARAHCSGPEASSTTATSSAARARTRRSGPWFDGYTSD